MEPTHLACLRVNGATIALNADVVNVDVVTFERLVGERTPEALGQAVELYRGDLLDGLTLQEPPFEEWLMAERERLRELALEFQPSAEEPSVLVPRSGDLLEVNFVGMDPAGDPTETYLLEDFQLPLMVFGPRSLVKAGALLEVEGIQLPLPRPAGLILEKLVTDRTGEKGDGPARCQGLHTAMHLPATKAQVSA